MGKKKKPQIWAEYALVAGIVSTFGLLPGLASVRLGRSIGRILHKRFAKLRRVGMRNLELAFPDKSETERDAILKGAFENRGRVPAVDRRRPRPDHCRRAPWELGAPGLCLPDVLRAAHSPRTRNGQSDD